jgi:hypothetical protein
MGVRVKPPHVGYAIIVCALACLALGVAGGVRWSLWLHDQTRLEVRTELESAVTEELEELARYRLIYAASDSVCTLWHRHIFARPECWWSLKPRRAWTSVVEASR